MSDYFGIKEQGTQQWTTPFGTELRATKYIAPFTGRIIAIGHYCSTASGSGNLGAGVYADSAGAPGAKLSGHTATTPVNTTKAFYEVPITPINVVEGTTYWLAFWGDSGAQIALLYETGSTNKSAHVTATFPTYPDPFGTPTLQSRAYRTWAKYDMQNMPANLGPEFHAPDGMSISGGVKS